MPSSSRLRGRAATALALMTVLVMASVGKCNLPQPKFPTLGETTTHVPADRTPAIRSLASTAHPVAATGAVGRAAAARSGEPAAKPAAATVTRAVVARAQVGSVPPPSPPFPDSR